MALRIVIVDDEPLMREELRYLLGRIGGIEVAGEAASGAGALDIVREVKPDLVFLDVQMPGINGLAVAQEIARFERPPYIVFATAYDEYAVKAFELEAVDYVLKPFVEERLACAIKKVRRHLSSQEVQPPADKQDKQAVQAAHTPTPEPPKIGRIPAQRLGKIVLVDPNDVLFFVRKNDLVYLRTYEDELPVNHTLQELKARLPRERFFRAHRNSIVNLEKIAEIGPGLNGTYRIVMKDRKGTQVVVSRGQSRVLRRLLNL